ncbi:MAG: hypothetical protein MUF08_08865 [Burkholderiaceae bacterium]|jgi:hypothetical protein|nr:hypothetical protein [Burkholderiaceae bacterium]MCU0965155.1 hypothetical protein [Burkholderiaceae bacterium]
MKVNGPSAHDLHGAAVRLVAKANRVTETQGGPAAVPPSADSAAAVSNPAPAGTAVTAPAESTVEMAACKLPPGLVRVAARLEAMGVDGRTAGQSNALAQINRNLQRYIDHQGDAAPPPLPELPADPPTASATDAAGGEDEAAVASGAEAPAEPVASAEA